MPRDADVIRTADICDRFADKLVVCELALNDYGGRNHFHGEAVTFDTYEDNRGIREVLARGGTGKVLVIDGRGSRRRALCGGNIAAEALKYGWEGMIINGCIRDNHEIANLDFGVKAVGTTAMRPREEGIGRVGADIYMGGIVIHPGDYIYADQDAVILLTHPVHDL